MRFRVTNVRQGYCEIWANERDGKRYKKIAVVVHDRGRWHWSIKEDGQPFFIPFYVYEFSSRRKCVRHCERTVLIRQMEHAIKEQPKEIEHWHTPRRDALWDMQRSHLFTRDEMEQWAKRAETFPKEES